MKVYKVRHKDSGKFLSKHGFSNVGRVFTRRGYIKTSVWNWKFRKDFEVVEFELTELSTTDINNI